MASNPCLIRDPKRFFHDLGGLHDARIVALTWDKPQSELSISVDDLNSNFLGLPEYKGLEPAKFYLRQVRQSELSIEFGTEGPWIYDIEVSDIADDGTRQILIRCSSGGRVSCRCKEIVAEYDLHPVPE